MVFLNRIFFVDSLLDAERRWNEGELGGAGFNCPLPQKAKEALLGAKEKRRDAYKQEYEERRMLNYRKKYGS